MGKWNKLTIANLGRHPSKAAGFRSFSNNWAPICEMFGNAVNTHPWITNSTNKDLSVKVLVPHHIISVSSLNYINKRYKNILRKSLYNVNHPKNLLLVPSIEAMSCELKVPFHIGNHREWGTVDNAIPGENIEKIKVSNKGKEVAEGYHFLVNGKVRKEIKKLIKKCRNYKCQEIVDTMDNLSKSINYDITYGKIKLNQSGEKYLSSGLGCGSEKCGINRTHNFYKSASTARALAMTSGRLKTAYEIYG
ncbi:AHH domain-containing protein [Vibrio coralliilyticus]|uniref:AHH domain-containing protein n=1 Tax=Vibrio coralliilyticus TaxID=190893 RepID=UPI002FCFDAF4